MLFNTFSLITLLAAGSAIASPAPIPAPAKKGGLAAALAGGAAAAAGGAAAAAKGGNNNNNNNNNAAAAKGNGGNGGNAAAANGGASASGTTWVVVVGDLNNQTAVTFTPSTVNAAAGDTVQYQFASANHTATQSAGPQAPCSPAAGQPINSGFVPVTQGAAQVQTFNVAVTDASQPIYMYCAQAQHCQQGMVMTINPQGNGANTKALAKSAAQANANVPANAVSGGTMGSVPASQVPQVSAANGKAKAGGKKGN